MKYIYIYVYTLMNSYMINFIYIYIIIYIYTHVKAIQHHIPKYTIVRHSTNFSSDTQQTHVVPITSINLIVVNH